MGRAIAEACLALGADVEVIGREEMSSRDLERALKAALHQPVDVLFMTAAVADYRPKKVSSTKLKRDLKQPALAAVQWEATPDILQSVAQKGSHRPKVVVGFCLVDRDLKKQTQEKRKRKNADVMIGNTPENLGSDDAKVLWCDARTSETITGSKTLVAMQLIEKVAAIFWRK